MRMRTSWLVATILGAAVASGCTTTSAGVAAPATTVSAETESSTLPSTTAPSDDDLPSDGAPKVTNPFDAERFEQDPCLTLSESQATELNVGYPGEPDKGPFGKRCAWKGPDLNSGRATVGFLSDEQRGMSSVYRSKNRGEFAFFDELDPVAGYPMVAFGVQDGRPGGHCSVAVGLTDQLVYVVYLDLSAANVGHKDPCELGAQVAQMTLTTMGVS